MTDDTGLWEDARGGDSAAFGALYERHRDRVFRQALRLVWRAHDAEDITALVFLEAWRKRDSVRVVEGSIIGWLLVTANYVGANAARSARRHRVAMAKLPPEEPSRDHADDVLAGVDELSRAALVRKAFARLSAKDQNVLTLCVVNDFSLAQAAETLGVPLGTAKSRLSRAKQRLATLTGRLDLDDVVTPSLGDLV